MLRSLALLVLTSAPALAGDLLVTSWTGHSVKRYDSDTGAWIGDLVAGGAGGLMNPHSAVFGPGGDVYVTSFSTSEVLRYDASGSFVGVFVAAGSGGLSGPTDAFFGPTGDLYVASRGATPGIKRYDGTTGAFVDQFADLPTGLNGTETGTFGPDGHFYLALGSTSRIDRYHGVTGDWIDTFVQPGSGSLNDPHEMAWGPDGHLYVTSFGNARVKRYDGQTGAFLGNFVKASGGLSNPHGIDFRPDGLLYIASFASGGGSANVRRYDASDGSFVDEFIAAGAGGLTGAISMTFLPDDTLNLSAVQDTFRAFLASPGENVLFIVGLEQGSRGIGPCPGLLRIDRALLAATSTADANGVALSAWSVPPVLSGSTLMMQALAPATCRASDVLLHVLP